MKNAFGMLNKRENALSAELRTGFLRRKKNESHWTLLDVSSLFKLVQLQIKRKYLLERMFGGRRMKTIYDYKCKCGVLTIHFELNCWYCHFRHDNRMGEEE